MDLKLRMAGKWRREVGEGSGVGRGVGGHVFCEKILKMYVHFPFEGLMDVKVVDSYEQLPENACKNSNGGCSHLCLRKPGGFSCQCPTGVKMKSNGRDCEDLPSSYLLIALRSGIGRISLDTPEMFDVVLPIEGVHGAVVVDFHYKQNLLFYADVNSDAIKRVNMKNFNDIKTIVSTSLNTPNG